jgi:Tol biopolymer transport system component
VRHHLPLPAAILALLFMPLCSAAHPAQQSPALPIAVAASSMQGHSAIWRLNVQSPSRPSIVVRAPSSKVVDQPVWSPDGAHLVYVIDARTLWQAQADGSAARVLYALPDDSFERISGPRYTPDGKTLGFTVGCCGNFSIFRIGADGSGLRRISSGGVRIFQDWAPDGTHMLFTIDGKLWTADPFGRRPTPIGNDVIGSGSFFDARYSPDDTHITASLLPASAGEGSGRVIVLMHDDGRYLTVLTPAIAADCTHPTWSPDGKRIAFVVASGPIGPTGRLHDIWIMRYDGRQMTNLTHGILGDVSFAAWSR